MGTTLVCMGMVYFFRLNPLAVQLVNVLLTPASFASFTIFIRYGEWLLGSEPTELDINHFMDAPLDAISTFWYSLLKGILAWCIFVGPVTTAIFFVLKPLIVIGMQRFTSAKSLTMRTATNTTAILDEGIPEAPRLQQRSIAYTLVSN